MKEIVLNYSGGTDSTAAAALLSEKSDRLHLATYKHSGISKIENSNFNIEKLKNIFGAGKFVHVMMSTEKLYRMLTYSGYLSSIKNHGFFMLSTCGLCNLAMHIRTIIYCMDNGITEAADGANKNSDHFPSQMAPVIEDIKAMYLRFGINFNTPVFDFEFPENLDWKHKLGLPAKVNPPAGLTTGRFIYERGVADAENVKGTKADKIMQPHCHHLMLHNLFALKYFIPRYGRQKYVEETTRFYKEKMEFVTIEIEKYLEDRQRGRFALAMKE